MSTEETLDQKCDKRPWQTPRLEKLGIDRTEGGFSGNNEAVFGPAFRPGS